MELFVMLIWLLLVCIIVFAVRSAFRLEHPQARGSDVWFHLHASEGIRKNSHKMPEALDGFVIKTPFDYPPLVHYLLSFISRKNRERLEPFFGSGVDIVQAIALFLFTFSLTSNYQAAFLSGILFAFFPMLVKADARVFFLSPRPFGELFASLGIILTLFFVWFGDIPSLALSMFCLSFVFLSSKFGTQAIVFLYIALTFFLLNGYIILILLGGLLLAILISKGHYVKVLKGHIRHSAFYRRAIVHKHSWTKQISGAGEGKTSGERLLITALKNPIFYAIAYSPLLVLLLLFLVFKLDVFVNNNILLALLAWSGTSLLLVVVISTPELRYLGEAERYMEYSSIPLCAVISIAAFLVDSSYTWILLGFLLLYSMILIYFSHQQAVTEFVKRPPSQTDTEELFAHLSQIPGSAVLCVPITTSFEVSYKSHHWTVFWGGNVPEPPFSRDDFDFIFEHEFPFPSDDLDPLIRKYRADHLLVWKGSLDRAPRGYYRDLTRFPLVFENSSYALYSTGTAQVTNQT
ncbi:MAG: hypothetical protein JSV43_04545 [Methanobacteriota archaeon]|nr:MAG: hypothetical protein JSV43_04545 [Euryarchaeota archaeon]